MANYTLSKDLMTSTSRLLERVLVRFQELDNGSTSFKLTVIVVLLSLPLVFVANRIRDKQQKTTLSRSVPTANRSSDMLSSTAAPPAGSVTVSKILIHPIKVSVITSISSLQKYLNGRRVIINFSSIRVAEAYLCKVLTTLQRALRCVRPY
jgi:hypothetical protein